MKSSGKFPDLLIDGLLLVLVYAFLLSYFPLDYLLTDTVVTGGDTGSHFKTVAYLKDVLLPAGKVIGWYPGNYGGYPLFLMYFPLLFVAAAGMSLVMPLTVSFKLVTVIGPILLPVCTYLMLRCCRLRFPGPGVGAAASLIFLFDTSNTMWGGNLASNFAGEFSYAFSFSLCFVLLGLLFRLVEQVEEEGERLDFRMLLGAIAVLYLVGLSHGFTLIVCTLAALYFLLWPKFFLRKVLLMLVVFGTGGLLFAAWFMQLVLNAPYTTSFNIVWSIASIREVLPDVFVPTMGLYLLVSAIALVPQRFRFQILDIRERKFLLFSWYIIGFSVLCYYSAETIGLPDIRFIPFIYFLSVVLGAAYLATLLGEVCNSQFVRRVLPLIAFCVCALWVLSFPTMARQWAEWNLRGYEKMPNWFVYESVIDAVAGSDSQPRVAYEHSSVTVDLGTVRAFENLPLFAGRATLEGLYFQSSLLSPFVFYAQSLYSKEISCPFPDYPCSRFDLGRAFDYLGLFNVNQIILVSEAAREAVRRYPDLYELQEQIPSSDYEIWRVRQADESYVVPLNTPPGYIEPLDYRHRFYEWFRGYREGERFLYTVPDAFAGVHGLDELRPVAPDEARSGDEDCHVRESVHGEVIAFETDCIGRPHLIKVAYNPGWQVEGASGVYLASPAYLLVYPTDSKVRLWYDNAGPRRLGMMMSGLGLLLLLSLIFLACLPAARRDQFARRYGAVLDNDFWNRAAYRLYLLIFVVGISLVTYSAFMPGYQGTFKHTERYYTAKDFARAQQGFSEITRRWPHEPTLDRIYYFLALSYFVDGQCEPAVSAFEQILAYPDSEYLAEAHHHIGICARDRGDYEHARIQFNYVINELKDPVWSKHSGAALAALPQ